MRILVTGGAGFVGSHVVDQLADADHELLVLDLLHPAAHRGVPDYLNPRAEYRWADLGDDKAALDAVKGCDAICHQASMVGLGVDFGDVEAYCRHNDLATAALLGALHRSDFRGRLVLASSMVVYGEGAYRCPEHGPRRPDARPAEQLDAGHWEPRCACGHELEAEPVTETAATDPRNVYAATKLHQEHLCNAFAREHPGVVVTSLRYHNVYGPRMPRDTPYAGVASLFRSALEAARSPRVFEDGKQLRDFVHVTDVARANVLALTSEQAVTGPLNVATGRPRSVFAMAHALADSIDGDVRPEVVGGYRLGDVRHVFASPERAAEQLGFRAEVELERGMAEFATAPLRT